MSHQPIIYRDPSDTGISPQPGSDKYGPLGEIYAVTFHHSAGPRATTKAKAQSLNRAYQQAHIDKGWGDIGYHFSLDDHGRFYELRDIRYKGAHVGDWNSGNVGIMVYGNYMFNNLTDAQRESIKWLFRGGFLTLTGEPERDIALVRGHQEWPGHNSNDCPGTNLTRHLNYRRSEDFH